ncbi:PxKF domain-containing protein [Phytohabitans rumicis]|nr:PxKF domain-containing protein [Phytohabitans rumicis]
MRTTRRPRFGPTIGLAAAVALAVLTQTGAVPLTPAAFAPADPLPRAYQVTSVAEAGTAADGVDYLALSADGGTAVHLAPRGEDPPVLVATTVDTGDQEVVGVGLAGQPVPEVVAAAVSADGRTVAFLAQGSSAAELNLPASADPEITQAVFVRDRLTDATVWVPIPDLGVPASRHLLNGIALSADGTRLATRISLPLPEYAGLAAEGVLLATLSAGTAPASRVVRPEDLVPPGSDPAAVRPEVRGFALSGDGAVLAVNARRASAPVLLRFAAGTGARLPADRALTSAQGSAWWPNLDHTGRRTALGGSANGVVIADLTAGPQADVTLDPRTVAPFVSGDLDMLGSAAPSRATLSADGSTVAFNWVGALWTQPAQAGKPARLASPGLDGRIADPLPGEIPSYPDAAIAPSIGADGAVLAFLSTSTAFVAPRTDEPGPPRLYRSVPADAPAPSWPDGARLTTVPGTTTVEVTWPAANGTPARYEVAVNGTAAATVAAPTTRTVLTDLRPGSTVDIAVVARDGSGRASAPLTAQVTLLTDLPPGDAPLSAIAGPGARVGLQWEAATMSGLTGYRILRGGARHTDLTADTTSYVDTGVANDTGYTYRVAALRGDEEIRLTRDATVHIDKLTMGQTATHLPPVLGTGYLALGRQATFAVVGAPGFTGTAELTVRTATEPAKQVRVTLAENEPGRYTGAWTIAEGVVEVAGGTLRLADGGGGALDRPVAGLPKPVGGLVRAHVDAPAGDAAGVRVQIWSDSGKTGSVQLLAGDADLQLPVAPADDHRLTATRPDGLPATPARTLAVGRGEAVAVDVAPSVPASATVTVLGGDGRPMSGVAVDAAGPSGPRAAVTDDNGRVLFAGLDAGATITATARLSAGQLAAYGLAGKPGARATLRPGDNPIQVAATALPRVRVTGTVVTPQGRPVRASVLIIQNLHGSGISVRTESGDDGTWSAAVHGGLDAPTKITADFAGGIAATLVTVGDQPPPPVRLVVPGTHGYVVRPTLRVKMLDAEATEQPLNYNNATHFGATLTWPDGSATVGETTPIRVTPGTGVQLCVDGAQVGLPKGCAETTAGDNPHLPIVVAVEERARFTARILDPTGAPVTGRTRVNIRAVDGTAELNKEEDGADVSISARVPGAYVLTVRSGTATFRRVVQAVDGQITQLGDLRLSAVGILDGAKSGFSAVDDAVLPGGLVRLRADLAYRSPTTAGTARITLPDGVTVPEGGVLLGDAPATYTIEEGQPDVLVVQLPPAPTRSLRVFAHAPGQAGLRLGFGLSVTAGPQTEPVSTVTVLSGHVSLTAGAANAAGRVAVSGRAPAGSTVVVREEGAELVRATAGPGGLWHAVLDLGAGDDVRHHLLRAEAAVGDQVLASSPVQVTVDPHAATLLAVTMAQNNREVTFRPADGVARFPFTAEPGPGITLTARFSGAVTNVAGRLDDTIAPMQPVPGEANAYQVHFPVGFDGLGDVSVLFDPIVERPTLPVPPMPADTLIDPEDATLADPVVDGATVYQDFTAPAPRLSPGARLTGRFTVTKLDGYQPSAEDRARAKAAGVAVYETSIQASTPDDVARTGELAVTASMVADLSTFGSAEPTQLGRTAAALGFYTGAARVGFTWAFNGVTNVEQAWSAIAEKVVGGKYGTVEKLQKMALECHDSAMSEAFQNSVQSLMNQALAMDAFNAGANLAAVLVAPASVGILSVAIWGVSWGAGKIFEYMFDKRAEELRRQMLAEPLCRRPELPDTVPDRGVRRHGIDVDDAVDPDAQPIWIYDPSGVVYEGTFDRPVTGATATLLHAPTPDGPWTVWDAEEFGQTNPLRTDDAGRYAWDVPEGWWKVAYTKDGYLPAESRVLKVLPPHTDVHANLVRAGLATVDRVEADRDGLTVTFNQPMRADQALGGLLAVTAGDTPVGGRWTAVSPMPAPAGHPYAGEPLATAFRFTGERHTGQVSVGVDPSLQDHAGRAVAQGDQRTVSVDWSGPDRVPPQVTVTGVTHGATYSLGTVPHASCSTVDDGSGVATEAALSVTGGTPAGVGQFTATCAGAVDKAGNHAAPVSVTYTVGYVFTGFAAPVDNAGVLNKATAGRAIPIVWRVTTGTGAPVTGLTTATLTATALDCPTGGRTDTIETYANSGSGLQNLGNGYYRINWKSPRSYAGSCKTLRLDLGEGPSTAHTALFRFVR